MDRNGERSTEGRNLFVLLKRLRVFAGNLLVSEFGPNRLREFRETLIDSRMARTYINAQTRRVRSIFKWGLAHEMVPAAIYQALQAVEPLRFGKTNAKESAPVKPVPEAWVNAVLPYCSPTITVMIKLQMLTGMRSGELVIMRTCDLNTTGTVWEYRPSFHKTAYRGHERVIQIGPQAQELLRSWLRVNLQEFLFQPAEAVEAQLRDRHANRKTSLSCGNKPGTNRKENPKRKPSEYYEPLVYARAVARAITRCNKDRKKNVEPEIKWHPHQLSHNAATRLRKEFDIETARVVLGHKSVAITQTYAEADQQRAAAAMAKIG